MSLIKLVDNCIKTFSNKKFLHTTILLFVALPYLSNLSLALRTRLQSSINKNNSETTLKQLLLFKITCSFAIMQFHSRTSKFWQVVIHNFILRSKQVFYYRQGIFWKNLTLGVVKVF